MTLPRHILQLEHTSLVKTQWTAYVVIKLCQLVFQVHASKVFLFIRTECTQICKH